MKKEENHNEKSRLTAKKYQIKQERENKSTRKVTLSWKLAYFVFFQYKKQLERVEADLKLIEAQESISTKLKRVNYYCIFKWNWNHFVVFSKMFLYNFCASILVRYAKSKILQERVFEKCSNLNSNLPIWMKHVIPNYVVLDLSKEILMLKVEFSGDRSDEAHFPMFLLDSQTNA